MKKKVFSLMMMLLLAVTGMVRAQELTVHDGTTTNSYVPFYGLWVDDYTRSEMIYPAEELADMYGATINSLTFYKSSTNTNSWGDASFQVYLKEVDNTTLDAYIGMTGATVVYEGGIDAAGGEIQLTINFTTPYTYNGGNLLVGIYETVTGSYSSAYWYGENVTGASASGYNSADPASATFNARNFLPKTTFAYNGGGGSGAGSQLVALQNGEVVETINVGSRPNGYWMEPFRFSIRNNGAATPVSVIDFAPQGFFTLVEPELPVTLPRNAEVEVALNTGTTTATAWQLVALYGEGRLARVWDVIADPYTPATPDIWELAANVTSYPYVNVPATMTDLHNDYTLPFPQIPEGNDAVYKLVINQDQIINASVTYGENGKVALYTSDFNGQGGPMADNYYEGINIGGGAGGSFEAMIGDETSTTTTGYMPYYTFYNYSLGEALYTAAELAEAGVTTAPMTSLSWEATSVTTTQAQNNISIWMANVSDEELTTTSYNAANMTLVFQGNTDIPTVGWNEFVFNQGSFAWDGTSNVLILCQRNNGTYNGFTYWRSHNPGFYGMAYVYQDGTPYDVTAQTYTLTRSNTVRPNIIMKSGSRSRDVTMLEYSAGPVIENLPVVPGTYYLVASSTTPDFEVTINAENMPCPQVATSPMPADGAYEVEPAQVTLHWQLDPYATEYRLRFGRTYYCEDVLVDWTSDLATSYNVSNLFNNTHYFWCVDQRNASCETAGEIWGFTTHLNIPQNLYAEDQTAFNDENVVLHWNAVADRTYRTYNVYRSADGVNFEMIGSTQMNNINATTYTDGPLAYNMNGYTYYVTAFYDEGESAPSNMVTVRVSGRGNVDGHVYEQDGATGIAGATVTMEGQDEYGVNHTYTFTTNAQGAYSGAVYAGSYNGQAAKDGYQSVTEPVQGNPIAVAYNNTTSPVDYILDENFDAPCTVIAEYYPDSLDPNAPYVKVYWGCGLPGGEIIEPFETGDFSLFDWQLDPVYPWLITTQNPYEGNYCMKSGNQQVLSSSSIMQVTVNIPADGEMSFFGKISSEQSWDYGYFYIDGVQMGAYTGESNWGEKKFPITAGDHTFKWEYTEDYIISSGDDCFYVDYITFYRQPEPAQPGWVYYDDGTNVDAIGLTAGGSFYWGVMFPPTMLAGNTVSKVSMYDYSAHTGTIMIYQGGTDAPGTLLYTQPYACTGSNDFVEWTLTQPVTINPTQQLWIVMNNDNGQYVASACANTGDPNGRWISLDGAVWEDVAGYGLDYTWMIRAYVSNGAKGEYVAPMGLAAEVAPAKTYTRVKGETFKPFAASGNTTTHTVGVPTEIERSNRAFAYYRIYRTDCYYDGPYYVGDPGGTILLASEVTDTIYIDVDWPDAAPGVYKWGVSCVYSGNRGELYETPATWGAPMAEATRAEYTYGFESGLDGWTVIDVNAGEGTWLHSSNNPGGYDYAALAHGGTGFAMCYSFVDYVGSYDTDSYLVSPQKYAISSNSTLTFWADNANDSYPEFFSVCVATADNPTASDFTQVWSGSAKGGSNAKAEMRHLSDRYENWRSHTVNLGAYAGQNVWIAFHDVNYDQYEVWIDDVTIVADNGAPTPPTPPTPGQGGTQLVNFEDGQIPAAWTNDATYPWVVTTTAYPGFNGTYCMMSGNSGVASSTSAMEATVEFVQDGSVSFLGGCWGEGTSTIWDKCQFFIDGAEQFSYGALQAWNTYSFDVTAGTHTFRWSYTKDGSVNPTGDAFFVDDITFDGVAGGLQEGRESEIVWSNCLEKGMYLGEDEVDITVLLNSADSPEGVTLTFTNYSEYEQELYPMAPIVLDGTGYYSWDMFRKGNYELKIEFDGYETIIDSLGIWEPTSLRYVMIEIIYPIDNLYVSSTGWAMWDAQGVAPTPGPGPNPGPGGNGDTFEFGFENGFEGWTLIDNDGDGLNWVNSVNSVSASGYDYTGLAHGGNYFVYSQSFIDYDGAYDADNYLVSPQKYAITNGSTLNFWADNANDSYPDHFAIAISTADTPTAASFTDIWSHQGAKAEGKAATRHAEGRYENWRSHSVDLSAYAGQNVWIAFHHQDYDMYEIWIDDVTLTAGAKNGERHLEGFKVMCESIDHEPIYNANTVHPFCQLNTEELIPGHHYICKVAAIYSTGMSDWVEAEWQYIPCDNYTGTLNGIEVNGTTVSWDYPNGSGPVPPQPGQGDAFSVDFEAGLPAGWTVIDGNNDGWTWELTSNIPNVWTYYAGLALDWYHNGTNAICSGSYINGVGALNPDEYLVSPLVTIANGSTFSFYAAATDATYAADHFGVFVSDNGTSNWTMVNEWTLTAKGGAKAGDLRASRDGNGNRLGNWYNYSVDLSAYAGQKYIAIRHFNCSDQYIMCVDDVELTSGAKSNRDVVAFNGFVTDPGAMANGADASWTKNGQATWGPNVNNASGYKLADSFTLSAATTISEIEVYGYQTGSSTTSTFTGFYAQIYDGNPMSGGNAIWGSETSNIMTATSFTNCYRGSDGETTATTRPIMAVTAGNLNIDLAAGTYWLVYSLEGTGTSGPWGAPHAEPGVGNTGNGVQYASGWQTLVDGGTGAGYGCAMKITGTGSGPVPPEPSGDVLGAMLFLDGEWEAFVPYPTNEYTYEEGGQYCVRMVYNGTNTLPEGNIYYSMSCPECVDGEDCAAGAPIHGEALTETDQVKVWWGEQPTPPATPIEDWLYYDDGANVDAIGLQGGGSFYWGIKFPANTLGQYEDCSVTKIGYFDYTAHTGTVRIYNGSVGNAPGALIGTYNYTANGTEDWVEWNIPAVAFDNSQDLWIVMNNNDGGYVAAVGNYTGDPNGTMLSIDGTEWYTLDEATGGQITGTWNLRCFVTNQAKGGEVVVLEDQKNGTPNGVIANAGIGKQGHAPVYATAADILKYNVYRSTDNITYTMIGEVAAVAGQTYYEYIDSPATSGTYYYQVRADYGTCESEPAISAENPSVDYVVVNASVGLDENDSNVALFPNPTNGNVTIQAEGMSRVTVVSVLGQVVYDTELNADEFTLNMAQFNAGMYMVRVYTEEGVVVKRVTVMQ